MKTLALTAIGLAILALPALAAPDELAIERARVWHKGTIKLTARFDPETVPDDFDAWLDGFEIAYGGFPIVTASYKRGRMTSGPGLLTKYRENRDQRARVRLDLGQGTLEVCVRNLVFPQGILPLAFEFRLRMNETVLVGSAEPESRKRSLRYRGEKAPKPGSDLSFRLAGGTVSWDTHR